MNNGESKVLRAFKTLAVGVIIAGIIMLNTGLIFEMFVAGIPYQDPTVEMQIEYMANMQTGEVLCTLGFYHLVIGIVFRVIIAVISKGSRKNAQGTY